MNRATGLLLIALLLAVVFFLSLPGTTAWQRVVQDAGHGTVFACIAVVLLLMLRGAAGRAGDAHPLRELRERNAHPLRERNAQAIRERNAHPLRDNEAIPLRDRVNGGVNGERPVIGECPLYLRAFVIAVAIGTVSEIVQYFQPNRHVSIADVVHDAAGAALGLTLFAIFAPRKHRRPANEPATLTAWLIALALGSALLLAWQPIRCATAYAERNRAFPTLLQASHHMSGYFAGARAADLTTSTLPARWRRVRELAVGSEYETEADDTALRLSFPQGTKPALELDEPAADWRGYDTLKLDLTNPANQPLRLMLRILDAQHDWSHADRFNTPITIPATSRIVVQISLAAVASAPKGREMDMAAIKNVMLFSRRPMPGTEFYVSRLWLE